MAAVITTVAPVFGLILLGFVAARIGLLTEAAGKGLGDFIFVIAMPALLFRTMVTAAASTVSPGAVLTSFFLANALTWIAATLAARHVLKTSPADAAPIAMGACFGNTVMLGLPLGLSHFGSGAASTLALVIAAHAPVLWLAATLQIEAALHRSGDGPVPKLKSLAIDLATNPIVLGVLAGSFWRATEFGLHPIADSIIGMLGAAAVPGALFALGMSLTRFAFRGELGAVGVITALKLVLMPLLAFVLAQFVFRLPPMAAGVVVLLAAVPTGANAYLFASRYERHIGPVSGAVALGTVISVVTISLLLSAIGRAGK